MKLIRAIVWLSAALVVAACASDATSTPQPAAPPTTAPPATAAPTEAPPTDLAPTVAPSPVTAEPTETFGACKLLTEDEIEAVFGPLPAAPYNAGSIGEAPQWGITYDCFLLDSSQGFALLSITRWNSPALAQADFMRSIAWNEGGGTLEPIADLGSEAYWTVQDGMLTNLSLRSDEFQVTLRLIMPDTPENRKDLESLVGLVVSRLPENAGSFEVSGSDFDACLLISAESVESVFGSILSRPQVGAIDLGASAEEPAIVYSCLLQTENLPTVGIDVQFLASHDAALDAYAERFAAALEAADTFDPASTNVTGHWEVYDGNLYAAHFVASDAIVDLTLGVKDGPELRTAVAGLVDEISANLIAETNP